MVQGEDETRSILKEYFEDVYNMDTQEKVPVHTCGFDVSQRGNYFEGEPIVRAEVGVRMGKLMDEKTAG